VDLHEERIACLRMAIDMGCAPDTAIRVAMDLMGFVASGIIPSLAKGATPDPVAACGTVLAATAAGHLPAAPVAEVTTEPPRCRQSGSADGTRSSVAPSPPPEGDAGHTGIAAAEATVSTPPLEPAETPETPAAPGAPVPPPQGAQKVPAEELTAVAPVAPCDPVAPAAMPAVTTPGANGTQEPPDATSPGP
jgi:hypothetical protein